MSEKEFPHKAQSRLDLGLWNAIHERVEKGIKPAAMTAVRMQTNDALKPTAMTPIAGAGEDRGLRPTPMTPVVPPEPAPVQPVNIPVEKK